MIPWDDGPHYHSNGGCLLTHSAKSAYSESRSVEEANHSKLALALAKLQTEARVTLARKPRGGGAFGVKVLYHGSKFLKVRMIREDEET